MRSSLSAAPVSLLALLAALLFLPSADAGLPPATPPEALLAEDTALYLRFDGLKRHRTAYEQTIFSRLMRDEFGPIMALQLGVRRYCDERNCECEQTNAPHRDLLRSPPVAIILFRGCLEAWNDITYARFGVLPLIR